MLSISYLRNQNLVALRNAHWYPLAVLVHGSWAHSQHLGLIELLHCSLWEEDTTGGLCFGLHALDEDTVEERGESLDGLEGGGLMNVALALRRLRWPLASYHFDGCIESRLEILLVAVSGMLRCCER